MSALASADFLPRRRRLDEGRRRDGGGRGGEGRPGAAGRPLTCCAARRRLGRKGRGWESGGRRACWGLYGTPSLPLPLPTKPRPHRPPPPSRRSSSRMRQSPPPRACAPVVGRGLLVGGGRRATTPRPVQCSETGHGEGPDVVERDDLELDLLALLGYARELALELLDFVLRAGPALESADERGRGMEKDRASLVHERAGSSHGPAMMNMRAPLMGQL